MTIKYQHDKDFKGAHYVTVDLLHSIIKSASLFTEEDAQTTITLNGGEVFKSTNLDDILQDTALSVTSIKKINISSSNYKGNSRSIDVNFGSSFFLSHIYVSISGPKPLTLEPMNQITNAITAHASPYSWFVKYWNYKTKIPVAFLISLVLTKYYSIFTPTSENIGLLLLIHFVFAYTQINLVDALQPTFLPEIVFKIGKSDRSYTRNLNIIKWVFSTVIVAGTVGYVINIITK